MKDLIIFLCVLASVLIVPALGWLSARARAVRNQKLESKPADISLQPGTPYRG